MTALGMASGADQPTAPVETAEFCRNVGLGRKGRRVAISRRCECVSAVSLKRTFAVLTEQMQLRLPECGLF